VTADRGKPRERGGGGSYLIAEEAKGFRNADLEGAKGWLTET